jgi:hypothetical protein
MLAQVEDIVADALQREVAVRRRRGHAFRIFEDAPAVLQRPRDTRDTEPRQFLVWSGRRDSNPRRPAWKAGTLPTELLPRVAAVERRPPHTWHCSIAPPRCQFRRALASLRPVGNSAHRCPLAAAHSAHRRPRPDVPRHPRLSLAPSLCNWGHLSVAPRGRRGYTVHGGRSRRGAPHHILAHSGRERKRHHAPPHCSPSRLFPLCHIHLSGSCGILRHA